MKVHFLVDFTAATEAATATAVAVRLELQFELLKCMLIYRAAGNDLCSHKICIWQRIINTAKKQSKIKTRRCRGEGPALLACGIESSNSSSSDNFAPYAAYA